MNKSQLIRTYLDKYRTAQTLTLARKIYRDNPALFTDLESCRNAIRYVRGAFGDKHAKKLAGGDRAKYIRPRQAPGDPFSKLPKALDNGNDWGPFVMQGPARVGILSDIHVPYHDDAVIELALRHLKKLDIDTLILNGDTMDFFGLSKFQKDPRQINFASEIAQGRQFLDACRSIFPKARILFKWGNHDTRFENYLILKAPELLSVPDFQMCNVLGFEELGIEEVKDDRPIAVGKLNVIHGHEYKFSISNPVGAARGIFMRANVHSLCGHFHQSSSYSKRNLEQKVISCFSTGCLCQINPEYRRLNDWCHGFAFCELDANDTFSVHNYRIFEGHIYE